MVVVDKRPWGLCMRGGSHIWLDLASNNKANTGCCVTAWGCHSMRSSLYLVIDQGDSFWVLELFLNLWNNSLTKINMLWSKSTHSTFRSKERKDKKKERPALAMEENTLTGQFQKNLILNVIVTFIYLFFFLFSFSALPCFVSLVHPMLSIPWCHCGQRCSSLLL